MRVQAVMSLADEIERFCTMCRYLPELRRATLSEMRASLLYQEFGKRCREARRLDVYELDDGRPHENEQRAKRSN